jgi:SAM-dependent methyltransferase
MISTLWDRLSVWRGRRARESRELDQIRRGVAQLAAELREGSTPSSSASGGLVAPIDRIESPDQCAPVESTVDAETDFPALLAAVRQDVRTLLESRPSVAAVAAQRDAKQSLERMAIDISNMIANLDGSIQSRLNRLDAVTFELSNAVAHLGTSIQSRMNSLDTRTFELSNAVAHLDSSLHTRINNIVNAHLPELARGVHEVAALALRDLALRQGRKRWIADPAEKYQPARSRSLDDDLALAREKFPAVYEDWHGRLEATHEATTKSKVGNEADGLDLYSRMFRSFVESHVHGRVLDVGCGTAGRPYYLVNYPAELISGIDPLPAAKPVDFERVRGISEFLPWPDASFSTLISATALDHCLSLERSLDEMNRVLHPDGQLLLWIGSVPGAPRFDPGNPATRSADKYHLFHIDAEWLEPLIAERFDIADRLEFQRPGYSHAFYALSLPARRDAENARDRPRAS